MWSQVVTLVTVKDINNYDLDGYFAPSTHYQLIGEEEGEEEERRLIDLHGFAAGKNTDSRNSSTQAFGNPDSQNFFGEF